MDGLDARGQVVVVAATNRIDAIDPALRRPGRFDRELLFSLPNETARAKIFEIHTRNWNPPPSKEFRDALAKSTVGFCGADIKQLCVEAALASLRRCFPQVYSSEHKLVLDPSAVTPVYRDFVSAMGRVVRSVARISIISLFHVSTTALKLQEYNSYRPFIPCKKITRKSILECTLDCDEHRYFRD